MSTVCIYVHQVFPTSPQQQEGRVPRRIHVSVYSVYIRTPSVPNITIANVPTDTSTTVTLTANIVRTSEFH